MSYPLYSELEQLNEVAIAMRRRGVLVDWGAYAKHAEHFWEIAKQAQDEFAEFAPADTKEVGKKKKKSVRVYQLGTAGTHGSLRRLFWEHFDLKPLRFSKETGAPNLDAWTLQQYSIPALGHTPQSMKLAAITLRTRKAAKILTTYLNRLPVSPDGRIHTAWNVWGAITGRWSSAGPNMQNIPKKLRDMFMAPPGWQIVAADYDKLELRIIAILANDAPLLRAFAEGIDVHTANAKDLFPAWPDDPAEQVELRNCGKTEVYGFNYLGRPETVHAQLLPKYPKLKLAQVVLQHRRWFERHPAIKKWHLRTLRDARDTWKVVCPLGHRVELFHDGRIEPNKVINFPVQAIAGWLANRAIIRWHERMKSLGFVTLQVHDELVGEFPAEHVPQAAAELKAAMEEPVELCGKEWIFPCELKVGANWGNLKKYDIPEGWSNAKSSSFPYMLPSGSELRC